MGIFNIKNLLMKFTALIALMATTQASDMHPIVRQDTPDAPVVNKKCTDDQEDDTVDTNRVSLCSTLSNCVTSDTPKVYITTCAQIVGNHVENGNFQGKAKEPQQ